MDNVIDAELEKLNLDGDETLTHQTSEQTTTTTTTNLIDKEMFEASLKRAFSLQNVAVGLITLDPGFYDDFQTYIKTYPDRVNRNLQYHLQEFIRIRVNKITDYACAYSQVVFNQLAKQEQVLYMDLCKKLSEYKKDIGDIIKLTS